MKPIIFLLGIVFPLFSHSQTKDSIRLATNTIYAEIGGAGAYYSLNYDKLLFKKAKNINVALGTGATYYRLPGWKYLNFLSKATLLVGKSPIFIGAGVTWINAQNWTQSWRHPEDWVHNPSDYLFPHVQVRYQPKHNGFHAALTGYFIKNNTHNWAYILDLDDITNNKFNLEKKDRIIWPGLSMGYTFSLPKTK
ncbi:MAG: hypothetical protein ACXWEY_07290 [Bacteroidia bacterium]